MGRAVAPRAAQVPAQRRERGRKRVGNPEDIVGESDDEIEDNVVRVVEAGEEGEVRYVKSVCKGAADCPDNVRSARPCPRRGSRGGGGQPGTVCRIKVE